MLATNQVDNFAEELILKANLNIPIKKSGRQIVIAICGPDGFGKTKTAFAFRQHIPELLHVQTNDVRQLMREHDLPYGENIDQIMHKVIVELLRQGHSLVLDGFGKREEQRTWLNDLAKKSNVKVYYIAVMGTPETMAKRAQIRMAKEKSGFGNWLPKPDKLEGYIQHMEVAHKEILEDFEIFDYVIDNNGSEISLKNQVAFACQRMMQAKT